MKTFAIALAAALASGAVQAADRLHGNTFNSDDSYQAVLSDVRIGARTPTSVQPAMGSGERGGPEQARVSPRGRNPDLDGSILYTVGHNI
jgi:hypothetical protein